MCAEVLGLPASSCLVVEDAIAGIEAAHRAGMQCIGIGDKVKLKEAELVIASLYEAPLY